jgi:CheY-like chemotaxis protein
MSLGSRRRNALEVELLMPDATQVLLVTAIRDDADAYERALEDQGVHVHVARTGEDALAVAFGQPLDGIVIDPRLPDASGWELRGRLHQVPALCSTPILILTRAMKAEDLVDAIGEAIGEGARG